MPLFKKSNPVPVLLEQCRKCEFSEPVNKSMLVCTYKTRTRVIIRPACFRDKDISNGTMIVDCYKKLYFTEIKGE